MKHKFVPAAPWRAALFALILGAGVTTSHTAMAQANSRPPERMTYQGYLVDGNGAVLGNSGPKNYDVIFRVWSSESGSSNPERLWSEQQTVTVDKGYFSVLLGEGTTVAGEARPALPTLFKGATASDRWVGITVKGIGAGGANVDILPRMRLLSSPYAFLAEQAVKLVRDDNSNDLLASSGNVLNLNGHLDLLGASSIEFGADVSPKEINNGRIGYQLYSSGLDIVGAGTNMASRRITFHAQGGSSFNGPVSAPSFDGTHLGDGSSLTGVAKLGANTFTGYQEVQNHLRVGELTSGVNSSGWGEALIFSGAPRPNLATDSDNSDPLWLARFNTAGNGSELRMVIGDDPGSSADAFVIGTMQGSGNFSQTATWSPVAAFTARGLLDFGYGKPKETSAGTIGYQVHSTDSLDIVGAGTTGSNRKVQMWAEGGFQLNGPQNVTTGNGLTFQIMQYWLRLLHPANKGIYMDIDRVDNGVRISGSGPWGNAANTYRQIVWDGDGNWDASSDRKLKKDIEDAESVLDRALKVQLRRFHWKDDPKPTKKTLGVIAQELQPLFPDMVGETTLKGANEKTLTVGYSDFGMIAIKALQEFKALHDAEVKALRAEHVAEIEKLTAKQQTGLQSLQAEVADLKAQMKQVLQAAAELQAASDKSKTTAAVTK